MAHDFHAAACRLLGLTPGRGSSKRVAEALGEPPATYSGITGPNPRWHSLNLLVRWAGRLGLQVVIEPQGEVRYLATPADFVAEAAAALEHVEGSAELAEDLAEARRLLARLRARLRDYPP